MSYLHTPEDTGGDDEPARMYAADRDAQGYVANYTKVFALNPDVYTAWLRLGSTIKQGMDLRRFELVTLAAARRLHSSYCALAHGKILSDRFYDPGTVRAIADDHHDAGLDDTDTAIIDFAERVTTDATSITAADIDRLRDVGLSDTDIFQVVLAAAARCFFSTVLDAVGAQPDAHYRSAVEPELQAVLTVGRPIATEDAP